MDERRTVKVSKYLSKHLRHQPERIGITLDANGWVPIDTLLRAMARNNVPLTRAELDHVVAVNDKRRFAVENDRIRASQGHTVPVDLDLPLLPNRPRTSTTARWAMRWTRSGARACGP